ncbi:MAG: tRNA (adenosine(37)-N6)-threonylcarbamoyltransferase complex ATPase subunit type 1 TsaE [Desulfobacterales bacterium]|nr:tRNA (adenosine(37)-N6)-threonylcarbamoyltransferase complex ATPase subunit type 1 TsaE [Desulfobacterales bacterium]
MTDNNTDHDRRIVFRSVSPEKTRALGAALGRKLDHGAVIALSGELGAGKTAFVQGLARGLGVPQDYYITSPSYTLVNEYPGRMPLLHVDLYRLFYPVDPEALGLDAMDNGQGVVAIEWVERMDPDDLGAHLKLTFAIGPNASRTITAAAAGLGAVNLLKAFETSLKELS